MRTLLIVIFIGLLSVDAGAQNRVAGDDSHGQDTIKIIKGFGGPTYHRDWEILNRRKLQNIIQDSQPARKLILKARRDKTVANIVGFAGGFVVGWSLSQLIITGTLQEDMLWGGGLILLSVPFELSAISNTKKAVEHYNYDVQHPGAAARMKPELRLGFTGNGFGLALQF